MVKKLVSCGEIDVRKIVALTDVLPQIIEFDRMILREVFPATIKLGEKVALPST